MNFRWRRPLLAIPSLSGACHCLRSATRRILSSHPFIQEPILRHSFFLFRASWCLIAPRILFEYGSLISGIASRLPRIGIQTNSLQGGFVWYWQFQLSWVHDFLNVCVPGFYRVKLRPIFLSAFSLFCYFLCFRRQSDMIFQQNLIHYIWTFIMTYYRRSRKHIDLCLETHLSLSFMIYYHLLFFFVTTLWYVIIMLCYMWSGVIRSKSFVFAAWHVWRGLSVMLISL